ncbi:chaperone protein dnaJ 49-like [Diospyros lotus]|uniref:chaperone protein dnaJ 49-like n=1 Tax=Diospyros lotus TaxID=55363 RepID=UPI0022568528|nr:chaperone protein dnaJ 49-like [Diospyros lotus]XP_052189493.1 chaperone protein dnaJ 49-like [Diospyros lotus]XP_052189494.1 chaperone protein dnaJ 49-like [Diospyros lotus]XP_052189495.1 chaperone protein dnaJ 49-like [Diospyros lotus]
MDSNKDEALRCVSIARDAIASGNKQRALKFIDIARRLNHNLSVDDLLAACENMNSRSPGPSSDEKPVDSGKNKVNSRMVDEVSNGERNYTEEHVQLVSKIKRSRDYYDILGVERSCSVEEVKRAYRKLSLKVHPDKNKAPGSEEAFKKVSKAFKCLSNDDSRREYDQTGLIEDFDYGQQYNVRRRKRRTGHDSFDDDFDPDEVFRSFFGHGPHGDMFRPSHVYRTRATANQGREENVGAGPNLILLLQILPFLIIFLLAYLPLSEPDYSLQKNYSYQLPRITEKHGIEFYVKSVDFDQNYPLGSPARASIEENVIKDYKNLLGRYCHIELQRRQWSRNLPTPHCDKLKSFGVA